MIKEEKGDRPHFSNNTGQLTLRKTGSVPLFLVLSLMMIPAVSSARVNSLTGGLSVSYDHSDRSYNSIIDDPDTEINEAGVNDRRGDDFQSIVLTPMLHFTSRSERDNFELRTAPGISYDLNDEETDLNNNLYVAADRFMTKSWQLRVSNHFLRSDYFNSDSVSSAEPLDPSQEVSPSPESELSTDLDRSRYWSNTFNIFSDHHYSEDSLFSLGFDYTILRNDDTGIGGYEDYDRYTFSFGNDHRFSSAWKSSLDLQFVRGEFDPADREVVEAVIDELAPESEFTPTDDQLSKDLNEYHLLFTVENESIVHNPLFLSYNYIGSEYDEALQADSYTHQMRFTWQKEFSPQLYTKLGIGPSYAKAEGSDGTWAGNGIVELDYQIERGSFNFLLDKRYDVDNFSGTEERGLIDIWDSRVAFNYLLQQDLSLTSYLSYVYEDREDQVVVIENENLAALVENTQLESYHTDSYIAGVGLNYSFMRYYSTGINYTFTKQESDRAGDTYDDHRIFLTLSWQKELARW